MSAASVDTLLHARWIVPIEPTGQVLTGHTLAMGNGRIQALLPTPDARQRFPDAGEVNLDSHALLPGLINLHTHAAMSLLRGLADDLPLHDWLQNHIWPAEARHASWDFVFDGTQIACAEMIRGGVTCFNDMYFFPEAAAESVLGAGIRAALGLIVIEFPSNYATDAEDYLSKGLEMRDRYKTEPLLRFCMAPHAPYTVSDANLERVGTMAAQLDMPIHIHLHETEEEISISLREHGVRPLQRLHGLGLLGPGLIAVHAVHLQRDEIALLARNGCHVAHCPTSNLKLASGVAPVANLMEQGVNLGLGTDGAASNNRLDIFAEMRLAALLAKGSSGQADAVPAHRALRAATLDAARALGLEGTTGSLEPGKSADVIAVDLSSLETLPCYDPVSDLVHAAGREQVTHVWVAGKQLMKERRLTTLDEAALRQKMHQWGDAIGRTGAA
jgi:5-methylthioadenosine/S-adenosylhomocysteine deaminase